MASIQKINSSERPQKSLYCACYVTLPRIAQSLIFELIAHAVKVSGLIFLSGQVPVDTEGKPVPGDIQAHTVCRRSFPIF